MLSHCVNPECSRRFLRLGEGKLFLVESEVRTGAPPASPYDKRAPGRRVERYWLCNLCAEIWTLVQNPVSGVELVPLPRPPARTPAQEQSRVG